jgi:predicted O-methyltransferase YrrM
MAQDIWNRVDAYLTQKTGEDDAALVGALKRCTDAGMPAINISPPQGKLLMLLAQMQQARRVLEIGTLGGYSTIWLARGLSAHGRVVTLELDAKHAEVARGNIAAAGLAAQVDVRTGRALDLLPVLEQERQEPFDLVFIDADKPSNPEYLAWALKLTHPGSVIICDNVVRDGRVTEQDSQDASIIGTRRLFDAIAAEPRLCATAIQTVGGKGYDGLAIMRVVA